MLKGFDGRRMFHPTVRKSPRVWTFLAHVVGIHFADEVSIFYEPRKVAQPILVIAERIRRAVEDQLFEARGDGSLRLTISIGVGTYPQHGETRDELLDAADKAMYRAKSQGRNCVCTASELSL